MLRLPVGIVRVFRLYRLGVPENGEDVGAVVNGVVPDKGEFRGGPKVHSVTQLPAEIAGSGTQALDYLVGILLVQHADKYLGKFQVVGGLHPRDGNEPLDPGVLYGANEFGEGTLDLFVDAAHTGSGHKDHLILNENIFYFLFFFVGAIFS